MGRCCDQVGLKKGPWTPDEDQKLLAYIQEHGHGSWRALPTKAGLHRCGKSCRLRWTNYLRPDIKRGKFSLQEEQTIIQLHAFLGNRWSAIATHLPQRTDNEIKNYWNTHLKKRLTKMGIDPVTHKPKTHDVFGCSRPRDAANLSHISQWESARLQAEATLVRRSTFVSNHYHSQFLNKTASIAPTTLPPRPPCLDVLKVWQGPWTKIRKGNNAPTKLHVFGTANGSLESPTSILNFSSGNLLRVVPSVGLIQDSSFTAGAVGEANNTYESHGERGIMDNSATVVEPNHSTYVSDSLRFPSLLEGSKDLPTCSTGTSDNFVPSCSGDFEENEINYWSNVLDVTTFPMGSPLF